jgi:hypothetical protein
MSADGYAVPTPEPASESAVRFEPSAGHKAAPSMSALLAAGKAAHAVCTPPAAPVERPEKPGNPGQRDAA